MFKGTVTNENFKIVDFPRKQINLFQLLFLFNLGICVTTLRINDEFSKKVSIWFEGLAKIEYFTFLLIVNRKRFFFGIVHRESILILCFGNQRGLIFPIGNQNSPAKYCFITKFLYGQRQMTSLYGKVESFIRYVKWAQKAFKILRQNMENSGRYDHFFDSRVGQFLLATVTTCSSRVTSKQIC